jgi:protoporphyrinogen oxidase
MIYNYIIIGGGISGLYTAYKIKQKQPNATFIILERDTIGGRMNIYNFCGVNVNIGAGVGRENKDFLLIKLLKELNITYDKTNLIVNYSQDIHKINFNSVMHELKKSYNVKLLKQA